MVVAAAVVGRMPAAMVVAEVVMEVATAPAMRRHVVSAAELLMPDHVRAETLQVADLAVALDLLGELVLTVAEAGRFLGLDLRRAQACRVVADSPTDGPGSAGALSITLTGALGQSHAREDQNERRGDKKAFHGAPLSLPEQPFTAVWCRLRCSRINMIRIGPA